MRRLGVACLGAPLWITSVALYAADGFGWAVGLLWLFGVLLAGAALYERISLPARIDLVVPLLLMAAFAPLYLVRVASWPVQVNSDEISIMTYAKQYAAMPHPDLFGLSSYFGHPVALLFVWGKLGDLLGGVTLDNMRLLHALTGLLTIGLSYAFFRQLVALPWAVVASAVFGVNHAFLMISRMAMRENTVVLVEMAALALLVYGLRRNHAFATFCGGALAGIGYYVHFPGRMIFLVWAVFVVVAVLAFRRSVGARRIARLGAISAVGFALVAAPYVVAYLNAPPDLTHHQREALLLTQDGRVLQEHWVFAHSIWGGIAKNIEWGLGAFNSDHVDEAFIYPNWGHGIVDPLTGALLWLGVATVLVRALLRRGSPWQVFPLVAFLTLWLVFAFVVGQAPDYPRMLVVLPFVGYLVAEAIRLLALVARGLARPRVRVAAPWAVTAAAVVAIGAWNGFIGWDFIHAGRFFGDDIGSTGRFVQSHSKIPGETFYIAADQNAWTYYTWGTPDIWQQRLRIFAANDSQVRGVIDPHSLAQFNAPPPFIIFMRDDLWSLVKNDFVRRYRHISVQEVTPDALHLAVEVNRA